MKVGAPGERIEITLEKGDTFWRLAEMKYQGRHPIAAILEANGLMPEVKIDENGSKRMIDPIYNAGATYILPGIDEVKDLASRFWQRIDEKYGLNESSGDRVGSACKRTCVLMHWDDTLWELAGIKYGGRHPMEAVYEANDMTPDVVVYAGHSYIFPAEGELDELTRRFRERAGSKKC